MTSFRSNLNSVSSTHDAVTPIQSRLTTCFKHLRQKFKQIDQETQKETIHEEYYTHFHQYQPQPLEPKIKWYQQNYKDSRILQKANENLRNLTEKLKKLFLQKFQIRNKKQQQTEHPKIIAKLLSSTLKPALTAASYNCTANTSTFTASTTTTFFGIKNKMTITGSSLLVLREEYPDLDREIRSILIARAQNGATIAEIKEDYRKNTGLRFPVYEDVTDLLLSIPGVIAYCTELGTRIFSVQPTEKTKHIFNLVAQQKAPSERNSYGNSRTHYRRDSDINSNFAVNFRRDRNYNSNVAVPVPMWRTGNIYKPDDVPLNASLTSSTFRNTQQKNKPLQHLQPPHSVDENSSPNASDGFMENQGGYYQDNCQYLFNRIYNYENSKENIMETSNSNYNSNNKNNNMNIIENQNMEKNCISNTQNQVPKNYQSNKNDKDMDMHVFKRPIGRAAVRGSVIRASSPSGTRSSQQSISDSIYSSDMNYDAHLLDFPLLGDDFFLYLARMELGCKFKKNQKILQSGLCVSGQTIKAAIKRVKALPCNDYGNNKRIIVNIGSVDIMHGNPLVQIEHDFRNLINIINKRGYQPILTTLAPLANYAHDVSIKMKLERFNEFIKREGQLLVVVDIWPLFILGKKQILFDCYQNQPRQVTGAQEPYVFWNKIGRQRVLKLIEANLEY